MRRHPTQSERERAERIAQEAQRAAMLAHWQGHRRRGLLALKVVFFSNVIVAAVVAAFFMARG